MWFLVSAGLSCLPVAVVMWFDRDLSCAVHVPIIGTTAVSVALCDALFGQIVSNTRWIPFSGCYTPSEAQVMVKRFRSYHMRLFRLWMVAKVCSSTAIAISATMIMNQLPERIAACRTWILFVGYVALGVSVIMVLDFIFTYFHAIDASDEARIKEINTAYIKDHPELFQRDKETLSRQITGIGEEYTSAPKVAKKVR